MIAAMAYPVGFAVAPYIFLTKKKEEPFVRFHAIQGLALNIVFLLLFIVAFFIIFLMAKTSPTYSDIIGDIRPASSVSQTAPSAPSSEVDPFATKWGRNYMAQGWFFIFVFTGFFVALFLVFLVLMLCAGKVWNGDDFRVPFLGHFIEGRYFYDYLDDDEKQAYDAKVGITKKNVLADLAVAAEKKTQLSSSADGYEKKTQLSSSADAYEKKTQLSSSADAYEKKTQLSSSAAPYEKKTQLSSSVGSGMFGSSAQRSRSPERDYQDYSFKRTKL